MHAYSVSKQMEIFRDLWLNRRITFFAKAGRVTAEDSCVAVVSSRSPSPRTGSSTLIQLREPPRVLLPSPHHRTTPGPVISFPSLSESTDRCHQPAAHGGSSLLGFKVPRKPQMNDAAGPGETSNVPLLHGKKPNSYEATMRPN